MERIPASERTREKLRALMEGRSEAGDGRSELVRLAARLAAGSRGSWAWFASASHLQTLRRSRHCRSLERTAATSCHPAKLGHQVIR